MNTLRTALLCACALAMSVPAAAAQRPVVPEDLFHLTFINEAQISPDGRFAALVVSHLDGPTDSSKATVELVRLADGRITDLTHGTKDGDIAWTPDSAAVYFVREDAATKHPQVFRVARDGGAPVRITKVTTGFVSSPVPSHSGKELAFTVTDVDAPHNAYVDFSKAGFTPKASQRKTDIRTIDSLFYEVNGAGYVYDKHPHIWISDASGAHARRLTGGQWAETGEAWTADDRRLVFGSLRRQSVDSGTSDIYSIAANGGAMQKFASDLPANYVAFPSREDANAVYVARGRVDDPAAYPRYDEARLDGTGVRQVVAANTLSWGDSLLADMKEGGGPCAGVLPHDRAAIINADGPGYANLRRLDLQTGAVTDFTPPKGEAWNCTMSSDGRTLSYLYSDFTHPQELYVADVASGRTRQVTHLNTAFASSVALSVPQPFTVKNSAGDTVHAWFMPAVGAKPGVAYPTLLDIHGGPETQFGDTFFHEFQVWAGLGYNVVFSDPRGSVGFGYPFESALTKHYGDAMFEDVQAVMDAAVQRPEVDRTRLGVTGGSYGGYATLWVIGHTNRYKAAAAERVVSDMQSENFGADFASKNGLGGFYAWGKPWDPNSMYREISPITYIENVKTPLLILHGEEDTRTPLDNTVQWFTLAKILGQTITFVDVPGETHDLSRTGHPIHRVERLHVLADWMNRYLK